MSLSGNSEAHRLDEYLQATLIGITQSSIDLEIHLTPGVAVLPLVMPEIDRDRDGRISADEARAYAARVGREVELHVDGEPVSLLLIETTFPAYEDMRQGLGTIRLKLRGSLVAGNTAVHQLRFENKHLPQFSVYLVNCLASPGEGLAVARQERDEAQRSIRLGYSFEKTTEHQLQWLRPGPFWLALIGTLLLARMVIPRFRWKAYSGT